MPNKWIKLADLAPPKPEPPLSSDGFWNSRKSRRRRARLERWRDEMFKDQNGLCHWCREPMSMERSRQTAYGDKPNDAFASFEHLKRIRDGGTWRRDNLLLSHAGCNRKRENKNHLQRYAHDPYRVTTNGVPIDVQDRTTENQALDGTGDQQEQILSRPPHGEGEAVQEAQGHSPDDGLAEASYASGT